MNIKKHSEPDSLERYSFWWSEARLVIAAIALFIGGVPVLWVILPVPALYGFVRFILSLSWLISGLASGYMLYRWMSGGKKLFGKKDSLDTTVFFVSVVSGINLGIAGLLGINIGMAISSTYAVFFLVALVYLASAYHLLRRWRESGSRIF